MLRLLLILLTLAVLGCSSPEQKPVSLPQKENGIQSFTIYSPAVGDSFCIQVSMPEDLSEKPFPVVYLLDANLYYKPMAAICRSYAEVGLLPPVILVGVGYKTFTDMDSLRHRDYTFPEALPRYEMAVSGGANRFARFIGEELPAYLKNKIPGDPANQVLMGHSLGGFYSMFHFWKAGQGEAAGFSGYVAASPSLDYNDNYLLDLYKKAGAGGQKANLFVTFGGLEDEENKEDPDFIKSEVLLDRVRQTAGHSPNVRLKTETYSNLGHMDTPLVSFIKGLQQVLSQP